MTHCQFLGDMVIGFGNFKDSIVTECQLLGDIV